MNLKTLASIPLLLAVLLAGPPAIAVNDGIARFEVAAQGSERRALPVALIYPALRPWCNITMGPFNVQVAPQAESTVKGLIVLSHGSEVSIPGKSGGIYPRALLRQRKYPVPDAFGASLADTSIGMGDDVFQRKAPRLHLNELSDGGIALAVRRQ